MTSTPATFRFSLLRREDVDAVIEVERRCFESPWTPGQFRHELKVPFSRTILAWARGEPERLAGYVCRWLVGDEISILNVAVDPAFRRAGLGRSLIELLLDEGRSVEATLVTLEVRENNDAARGMYEAFGFLQTGMRKNYYGKGDHALIMTKEIDSKDDSEEGLCPNPDTRL